MIFLYKDPKDVVVSAHITTRKTDQENIIIEFSSDCGKFGTDEILAGFKLSPSRLLDILHEREDVTDDELDV